MYRPMKQSRHVHEVLSLGVVLFDLQVAIKSPAHCSTIEGYNDITEQYSSTIIENKRHSQADCLGVSKQLYTFLIDFYLTLRLKSMSVQYSVSVVD